MSQQPGGFWGALHRLMSASRGPVPRTTAVVALALVGVVLWMTGVFTGMDFESLVHDFESDLSPMLRYARTLLCVALVWVTSRYPLGERDQHLVRIAFLLVAVADWFVILHPDKMLIGMLVFMAVHLTLAVRHAQGWRASMAPPLRQKTLRWLVRSGLIIGVPGLILLYFAAPALHKSGLFVVDVIYLLILLLSAWMGWGTLVRPFFPNFNARIIAVGMTFFFVCDVSLGLSHALSGQGLVGGIVGLVPDLTYSWALLGLALSAMRWDDVPDEAVSAA